MTTKQPETWRIGAWTLRRKSDGKPIMCHTGEHDRTDAEIANFFGIDPNSYYWSPDFVTFSAEGVTIKTEDEQ